jgi:hypothetical protein
MNQVSLKPESATARDAGVAKIGTENCPARFARLHRLVGGREIPAHQVEKNRIYRKTWYCAIFQMMKSKISANQSDAAEIGRNRSRKFLGFPEKFSGGYIPPPGGERRPSALESRKGETCNGGVALFVTP